MNELFSAEILTKIFIAAALILAVFEDLKTKKVRNKHVLIFFGISVVLQFFLLGISGVINGFMSCIAVTAALLPLVLLKVVGAGDLKLMMAISFLMPWQTSLNSIALSLVWGSAVGLLQIILNKGFFSFLINYRLMLNKETRTMVKTHTIPFTVALLLGWASQISLEMRGIEWLF